MQQTHNAYYCPVSFANSENVNGSLQEDMWRDILWSENVTGLQAIRNVRGCRYQERALEQRDALKDYFMNENILAGS